MSRLRPTRRPSLRRRAKRQIPAVVERAKPDAHPRRPRRQQQEHNQHQHRRKISIHRPLINRLRHPSGAGHGTPHSANVAFVHPPRAVRLASISAALTRRTGVHRPYRRSSARRARRDFKSSSLSTVSLRPRLFFSQFIFLLIVSLSPVLTSRFSSVARHLPFFCAAEIGG